MEIDGCSASQVLRPQSIEELARMVSTERGAIAPSGAGTQIEFGNPLQRLDCAIDLTGLSRITEYNPADLTIHVEAGVTLKQLEHALLENNQFLPLDPWNGPAATIGGIAAANAQGPLRAVGSIRDWIIGMKVVEADGRITKAGGRVVKNVTGYDIHKLYTGSLGTLAIIAEISLKLRSKFARTATAIARLESREAAAGLIAAIRQSALQPVAGEWVGPENEVWLRFGEHARAVEWQLKSLPAADWKVLEGEDEAGIWEKLRLRYQALAPIVLRVLGLPTQILDMVAHCRPSSWIAHGLNGIVLMEIRSAEEIGHIRSKYRTVIERAPLEVRRRIATFALDDIEYGLMKKMKDAYDPEGRLNPGRHVDGERLNG